MSLDEFQLTREKAHYAMQLHEVKDTALTAVNKVFIPFVNQFFDQLSKVELSENDDQEWRSWSMVKIARIVQYATVGTELINVTNDQAQDFFDLISALKYEAERKWLDEELEEQLLLVKAVVLNIKDFNEKNKEIRFVIEEWPIIWPLIERRCLNVIKGEALAPLMRS